MTALIGAVARVLGLQAALAAASAATRRSVVATATLGVAVNALLLVGVVGGWLSPAMLLATFWFESVVIGVLNVVRIVTAAGDRAQGIGFARVGIAAFFCVHYGIFTVVHGVFLAVMISGVLGFDVRGGGGFDLDVTTLVAVVAVMALQHAWSLVRHWFVGGERLRVTVQEAMSAPYRRVILMHVAILVSGFLMFTVFQVDAAAVLLLVGKAVLDLRGHLGEHLRWGAPHDVDGHELRQPAGNVAAGPDGLPPPAPDTAR